MNTEGEIYVDDPARIPQEDIERLREWGDEIEAEELERKVKELEAKLP
jgi:hypothetical protein